MKKIFGQLSSILTTKDKKFASYLLVFSIVISVIEMLGVAIIMPFISVASDFSTIDENAYYSIVYSYFNFRTHIDFVVSFGVVLVVFYIFRGVINLYYIYFLERFSLGRHHLIVCRLFENYMGMSYRNFIDRNSSEFTKAIVMEAWNLTNIFKALLFMVSEVFIIIFIYLIMLYMSYKATLVLTFFLTLNFFFLTRVVSKKIKTIGIKREKVQRNFFEIINSTLGNFKLIKLHSHDVDILNKFKSVSYKFSKINIVNSTLGNFPKVFLEAVGFSSIVFSIIFIVWKYQVDITSSLPLISMFVLGLYRLMPSVNRIMNGYNSILFNLQSLNIVRNDLLYYVEDYGDKKINFNNDVKK